MEYNFKKNGYTITITLSIGDTLLVESKHEEVTSDPNEGPQTIKNSRSLDIKDITNNKIRLKGNGTYLLDTEEGTISKVMYEAGGDIGLGPIEKVIQLKVR